MVIHEGRVIVRWFDPVDAEQLADLHACCYPRELWLPEDFARFVAKGGAGGRNVVKVLSGEDRTVYGSLLYTLQPAACRLRRVAVWPDFRRQGLGRFTVNSVCGPRSPMRRRIVLASVPEGDAAAAVFLRDGLGFSFDPARPREKYPDGRDRYEFVLDRAAVHA